MDLFFYQTLICGFMIDPMTSNCSGLLFLVFKPVFSFPGGIFPENQLLIFKTFFHKLYEFVGLGQGC